MKPDDEPITIEDLQNLLGELRMMARALLNAESNAHSVTPTALALTALRRSKLVHQDWEEVRWENRAHFFTVLAMGMRHALIDRARRARARGRNKITAFSMDEAFFRNLPVEAEERPDAVIALEEVLAALEERDPRLANAIQQHYFMGYTLAEMARFSAVSEKTVARDLDQARVFLLHGIRKQLAS